MSRKIPLLTLEDYQADASRLSLELSRAALTPHAIPPTSEEIREHLDAIESVEMPECSHCQSIDEQQSDFDRAVCIHEDVARALTALISLVGGIQDGIPALRAFFVLLMGDSKPAEIARQRLGIRLSPELEAALRAPSTGVF